jgi:hypothetical protein
LALALSPIRLTTLAAAAERTSIEFRSYSCTVMTYNLMGECCVFMWQLPDHTEVPALHLKS